MDNKRRRKSDREQLAQQAERLRTAETSATTSAAMADLIVQRSKESDVSTAELANLARMLRGGLLVLSQQLADESRQLGTAAQAPNFRSTGKQPAGRTPPEQKAAGP